MKWEDEGWMGVSNVWSIRGTRVKHPRVSFVIYRIEGAMAGKTAKDDWAEDPEPKDHLLELLRNDGLYLRRLGEVEVSLARERVVCYYHLSTMLDWPRPPMWTFWMNRTVLPVSLMFAVVKDVRGSAFLVRKAKKSSLGGRFLRHQFI